MDLFVPVAALEAGVCTCITSALKLQIQQREEGDAADVVLYVASCHGRLPYLER
jgi:hypothetical protein